MEPIQVSLEKVFRFTETVRTFRFRFPAGKWVPFKAGQFCMVHIPPKEASDLALPGASAGVWGPSEEALSKDASSILGRRTGPPIKTAKKAYSICSAPFEEGYVDLCVKRVEGGYATNWFWQLTEGDAVTLTVPYGGFIIHEPLDYDPVFVATGTGLAPLRSMIKTLLRNGFQRSILLIFGVRYENEILYEDEFRDLEKRHSNFRFIPTISRPREWKGETGYVQETLRKQVADPHGKRIYVCGLVPMIEAVEKAASEIGFDKKAVYFEKYV